MPGWLRSASSGPLTWMLSHATSTAWTTRHQRKRRQGEDTDERPVVDPPGRAGPALPRGGVIQNVQVRRAREPHARALAGRMARARRARDGGRGPAGRPGRHDVDARPDPTRRRRARAGNPGPRRAVRAVFAETGRYQPAGLGRRNGAAGGLRGLRAVRAQAAGLIGAGNDRSCAELTDWRGKTLASIRKTILEADREIIEEWKWMGSPVWSHNGMIAVGNAHKDKVKLTFSHGASLPDPDKLFNAGLEGNVWRAIDVFEGDKINERALRNLVRAAAAYNQINSKTRAPAGSRAKVHKGKK